MGIYDRTQETMAVTYIDNPCDFWPIRDIRPRLCFSPIPLHHLLTILKLDFLYNLPICLSG